MGRDKGRKGEEDERMRGRRRGVKGGEKKMKKKYKNRKRGSLRAMTPSTPSVQPPCDVRISVFIII